ncbi:MAG: hypothetical protein CENE_02651 [Candidatus Celerinatantimonas neptuna]|nr:MAG: hypothetical protein CENE_02651 [Candidatus Celerinatantimonas neptuna]
MGINKLGLILRIAGGFIVLMLLGYFRFENHRLHADLIKVNQQLGAANQRETVLLNANVAMRTTVRQLRLVAHQEHIAAMRMEIERQGWLSRVKTSQLQIKEALMHEVCAHRSIPGAAGWMYYQRSKTADHPISNELP